MAGTGNGFLQSKGGALNNTDLFAGVLPFVVTAELGSFRAAARQLGVTPSAISKAIGRLEHELGVRLLHRTARVVRLTSEGAVFLAGCREAVENVRNARTRISQSQKAPRGRLRVSLPLMLGRSLLPRLTVLLERYPSLSLDASLNDRFVDFAKENVDAAIRIGTTPDSRVVARKLHAIRWVTVASPRYLARYGTPTEPRDLAQHNCLAFVTPAGTRRPWEYRSPGSGSELMTLRPSGSLAADHGEALVGSAIAGIGLFQAHDYTVADALERGVLLEVLAPFVAPGPTISLLYAPGRRASVKVRIFGDLAAELLSNTAPEAAEHT